MATILTALRLRSLPQYHRATVRRWKRISYVTPEYSFLLYQQYVKDHALSDSPIEVGSCSCVGIVGATLGGGVGPYGGLHGLQIDALQSVQLVTGTGALINVSATSYPDLWWGMLGAGFNFGIVTSATYKVYDFTNNGQAMSADLRFYASQNASIYEFVQSFEGKVPDEFSLDVAIAYNDAFNGVSRLPQAFQGARIIG